MAGLNGPSRRAVGVDLARFPGLVGGQLISGDELAVTIAPPVLELTLEAGDGFTLWTP
jgi:hypothetical protein